MGQKCTFFTHIVESIHSILNYQVNAIEKQIDPWKITWNSFRTLSSIFHGRIHLDKHFYQLLNTIQYEWTENKIFKFCACNSHCDTFSENQGSENQYFPCDVFQIQHLSVLSTKTMKTQMRSV